MGTVALLAFATFLYGTLVGWALHWAVHHKWAGPLYRAHLNHHTKQYPPSDLVSETYRGAGRDNSTLFFAPLVTLCFCVYFYALARLGAPSWAYVLVIGEAIFVGFLHDWVHTQFHLTRPALGSWKAFRTLQRLHFIHHRRMNRNFGILWLGWDRVFRSQR